MPEYSGLTKRSPIVFWLLFHLIILILFLLFGKLSVDTSLYSILPDSNPVQQLSEVEKSLSSKLNSNLTVLIGHEDFSRTEEIAAEFFGSVEKIDGIGDIKFKIDNYAMSEIQQYLFQYRYQFLSPEIKALLESGNLQAMEERAFFTLSSPVSMGSLDHLAEDPYLLANETLQYFLSSGILGNMAVGIRDSVLTRDYEGKSWILITMKTILDGSAVDLDQNPIPVILELADSLEKEYEGSEFIFSGVPLHSYDSARKSQREISLLSSISTLFIILIILLVFRSIQPLAATLIAIGTGILTGLATTLIIFEDIHIFTIVFGTSLIGISVDYSFHYFTEWSERVDNKLVLHKILPGITIGLITTMLSYGAFTLSSFPLLQQMALFSMAGLVSTYISVIFLYPNLRKAKEKTKTSTNKAAEIIKKIFFIPARFPGILSNSILFLLLLFTISGLWNFKLNNNIRDLYKMSTQLYEWEKRNAEILDHGSTGIYMLIEGDSLEDNLRKEELLTDKLTQYAIDGILESHLSLSDLIPSEKSQVYNLHLVSQVLFPAMGDQLTFLGYDETIYKENLQKFDLIKKQRIKLSDLDSLPLNSLTDTLHIGYVDGRYYTAVLLFGISDLDRILKSVDETKGVYLINKAVDTSRTLQELSILAIIIIGISYVVIFIMLIFRYGVKGSLKTVSIPIAASLLTLSLIVTVQLPVNLFVVVGLILIPGMGTDYIILLSESGKTDKLVYLSITLSMLTSVLAFGLLGFTSIAGVFGLTVSFGVLMTYLLTLFFNSASLGFRRKRKLYPTLFFL